MRWIAAPLIALLVFLGSGFVSSLARTTKLSAALAASAEEAPQSTGDAARQTSGLPIAARLTGRQADAFDELVTALKTTAEQVGQLDRTLTSQSQEMVDLHTATASLRAPLGCAAKRLRALAEASATTPERLEEATRIIGSLIELQDRSVKHLRSINRKLAALGALATATDTEPLPRPTSSFQIPKDPRAPSSSSSIAPC